MIFKQVFDTKSSTYTYLIASAKGREAIMIDPVLDNIEEYISLLNEFDLKLVKVIDTHIHADHITGLGELREKFGCETVMGFQSNVSCVSRFIRDNEVILIDELSIRSIYTPGHTDDSYSYLLKNNDGVFEDVAFDFRVDDVIQNGRGTALSDILYRGRLDIISGNWQGYHRAYVLENNQFKGIIGKDNSTCKDYESFYESLVQGAV